jgi:hypothetical protein
MLVVVPVGGGPFDRPLDFGPGLEAASFQGQGAQVCADAWYRKPRPTFTDTLAAVRRQFWCEQGLLTSRRPPDPTKLHPALHHGIVYALCHAA